MDNQEKKKGFNFVGLGVGILIVVIIAVILLFVFDPIQKFKSARDAERWQDVSNIVQSLKKYEEDDEDANLFKEVNGLYRDDWYMIVAGPKIRGCDDHNEFSDVEIFDDHYCLNLSVLVDKGYIGEVPVSPEGNVVWDEGLDDNQKGTGYAFMIDENNVMHIQACESENVSEILISRDF